MLEALNAAYEEHEKHLRLRLDKLQKRHIPFRRDTSSFIGACALGNRDKCTTWFDSVEFATEVQPGPRRVAARTI